MASFKDMFGSAWRYFVTDGVPSSGPWRPSKADIVAIGSALDTAFATAVAGITTVANLAARDTFYADPANQSKLVYVNNNNGLASDPANGVYEYVGAPRIAEGFYSGLAAVVQPLVDEAQAAADTAVATRQPIPAMPTNFKLDPNLGEPPFIFTTSAPVVTATDPVFIDRGYLRQITMAAGNDTYQQIFLDRPVLPGEWFAFSILIAIDDATKWGDLNGRVATGFTPAGGDYGSAVQHFWDTVNNTWEAIDANHRAYFQLIQNDLTVPCESIFFQFNLDGKTSNLLLGGLAIAASPIKPVGVSTAYNDPYGVEALKKASANPIAQSVRLRGDSLIDGTGASSDSNQITARIAHYLGGTYSKLGVPGSFSQSAIDRACGVQLTISDNKLPAAGGSVAVTGFHGFSTIRSTQDSTADSDNVPLWCYQPLTSPARPATASQPFSIMGVTGSLVRTAASDLSSESYAFTYAALPADIPLPALVTAIPAEPDPDLDGIWAGANDRYLAVWAPNIAKFLDDGRSGARRFAIGPVNTTTETAQLGGNYNTVRAGVETLTRKYRHFIDIQAELCRWGLVAAGLTPTSADLTAMSSGVTSVQLHASGDITHLNDAGYDAVAQIVICHFLRWGWVETDTLAHVPTLWALWQ